MKKFKPVSTDNPLRITVKDSDSEPGLSLYTVELGGQEIACYGATTPAAHNGIRRSLVDLLVDLGVIVWFDHTRPVEAVTD